MDDKRVAGLRTFDIKRSGLRIRTSSALRTGCVPASSINRVGIHAIPRFKSAAPVDAHPKRCCRRPSVRTDEFLTDLLRLSCE